jgi:hypothetical protein
MQWGAMSDVTLDFLQTHDEKTFLSGMIPHLSLAGSLYIERVRCEM